MKQKIAQILKRKKKQLQKRLERKQYTDQERPMFQGGQVEYELAEKSSAIGYGGIGAIHTLVRKLKLDRTINQNLHLLKTHVPYWESDHILNMAYNLLCGSKNLEDLERLRQDEAYGRALGAERIPDPTTAGDFLRRFEEEDIQTLQEVIQEVRQKVWAKQGNSFQEEAILEVDGTIAVTSGECKQGMDIAYNGEWGYAPLVVTLANTKEVLYLVNRPGNRPSSEGAEEWIERAITQLNGTFQKIWLRGDTDFSMTGCLDGWEDRIRFVLGYDACANLKQKADDLPPEAWQDLQRPARYEISSRPRVRPEAVKEQIVQRREYQNIRLMGEQVAEFDYRPTKCRKSYRMVVVRKNLSVEKGHQRLFENYRYFFYITNDRQKSAAEVVFFANDRCNQENIIEQLKNGVHALRLPTGDLVSNWAYMVIAGLAWNLKAWYGLMQATGQGRQTILKMEFRRFLLDYMQLPCQIVTGGRRILYRLLSYTTGMHDFFSTWARIQVSTFP